MEKTGMISVYTEVASRLPKRLSYFNNINLVLYRVLLWLKKNDISQTSNLSQGEDIHGKWVLVLSSHWQIVMFGDYIIW